MRRLVLTADDAGLDPEVDRAVARLLAGSALTAVSVVVDPRGGADLVADGLDGGLVDRGLDGGGSPGARRALELIARAAPGVAPGVHVVLPSRMPAGGLDDVADRVTAQVEELGRVAAAVGARTPGRLDSHRGTLYGLDGRPYVAEAITVCARFGLSFRLPRGLELYGDGDPVLESPVVRTVHTRAVAAADAAGVRLPRVIATCRGGDAEVGDYPVLRERYLRLLGRLPEGTSEIFLHPAPDTRRMRVRSPGWWRQRAGELRLLDDPVFTREIDRQHIDLVGGW